MNSGAGLPCIEGETFSGGGTRFCKNCDARDAENPSGRRPATPRTCPSHARLEIFWMVTGGSDRNEANIRPATSGLATPDHTFVTPPEQNFPLIRPEPQDAILGGQQRKPTLFRDLFQCETAGARSEHSDRDDDHEHSEGDKSKNSCSSKTLEEESNDEAGKCGRQTSPGINEPNRGSPHTGRKQLRLIRVRAIAQKAVHESNQDAEPRPIITPSGGRLGFNQESPGTAGPLDSTATPSRQVQLGAKVIF